MRSGLEMPLIEIPTTRFKGVEVEGGWQARVPRVTPSREDLDDLVTTLMLMGATRAKAEEAAPEMVTRFFEREWRSRLMKIVGRYAKKYADEGFGSLEGFEPERVARRWVPMRGGDATKMERIMRKEFEEMRREML